MSPNPAWMAARLVDENAEARRLRALEQYARAEVHAARVDALLDRVLRDAALRRQLRFHSPISGTIA